VVAVVSAAKPATERDGLDDAVHIAAPWDERVSLCGRWQRTLAPLHHLPRPNVWDGCWSCLQAAAWVGRAHGALHALTMEEFATPHPNGAWGLPPNRWQPPDWVRAIASSALQGQAGVPAKSRQELALAYGPEIVCVCGSTRFHDQFQQANYDLTMAGKIVLTVGFYPHAPHAHGEGVGATAAEKLALDDLHKRKIDLADRVLVLNVGGYIGDSTRSEIEYAASVGVPVDYLEEEPSTAARGREGAARTGGIRRLAKKARKVFASLTTSMDEWT
jgi:hypothetical protein